MSSAAEPMTTSRIASARSCAWSTVYMATTLAPAAVFFTAPLAAEIAMLVAPGPTSSVCRGDGDGGDGGGGGASSDGGAGGGCGGTGSTSLKMRLTIDGAAPPGGWMAFSQSESESSPMDMSDLPSAAASSSSGSGSASSPGVNTKSSTRSKQWSTPSLHVCPINPIGESAARLLLAAWPRMRRGCPCSSAPSAINPSDSLHGRSPRNVCVARLKPAGPELLMSSKPATSDSGAQCR